jgi:hypothetical protein
MTEKVTSTRKRKKKKKKKTNNNPSADCVTEWMCNKIRNVDDLISNYNMTIKVSAFRNVTPRCPVGIL